MLPCLEADHSDWRGALHVVGGPQQATGVGTKAEGIKRISGDEFAVPGLCGLIAACAANSHLVVIGFEGSKARETRGVVAKLFVLRIREQRPVIYWLGVVGNPAVPAALLVVAYAQKGGWVLDGQRPQEHGVHQREDGRGGSDAERDGEGGSESEAG